MASFFAAPRLSFGGSANASAASSWSFGTPQQGTSFSTSSSTAPGFSFFSPHATNTTKPLYGITASPRVQELSYEALVEVSAPPPAFGNLQGPLQDTLKHPSTVANSDIEILRIYLPFDKVPLSWLNALFVYIHQQPFKSIREVQLCIRSLLRPCLQDIDEDPKLEQGFQALRRYITSDTSLKFFFLRPRVQDGFGRDCFADFVEKDLLRAIEGLREHDVELSEILGEESCLFNQSTSSWQSGGAGSGYSSIDLDDDML